MPDFSTRLLLGLLLWGGCQVYNPSLVQREGSDGGTVDAPPADAPGQDGDATDGGPGDGALPDGGALCPAEPGTGVSIRLHDAVEVTDTRAMHRLYAALRIVSAMVPWSAVAPAEGVYDWDDLETNLQDAADRGYRILLRLVAGSSSPAWLYDGDRPVDPIEVYATNPADPCAPAQIPIPWNVHLEYHYRALVRELGSWLEGSDGRGGARKDHVYAVVVAMPMVATVELAASYGPGTMCGAGTAAELNRAAWDALSSEDQRREWTARSWRNAITAHMEELPQEVASVVAYGPLFGDDQLAAESVAVDMSRLYGCRLFSMYTNLRPQENDDGTLGVWSDWCVICDQVLQGALREGGRVGFQTAPIDRLDTVAELELAAEDALERYGMRFLEAPPVFFESPEHQEYLIGGEGSLQDMLRATE